MFAFVIFETKLTNKDRRFMVAQPTAFEKSMDSVPAALAVSAIAAALPALPSESSVTVVAAAALIPPLFNSLPGQRQKRRMEEWQVVVSQDLEKLKYQLQRLTDEQYQLINEFVSAASQTISAEKLGYLRSAVRNTVAIENLATQEACILGRIIRDISAQEADFVCKNFSYEYVFVGSDGSSVLNSLRLEINSKEFLIVKGLAGLGVLDIVDNGDQGGLFGKGTYFTFSKITSKLIVLLQATEQEKTQRPR